MPSRANLDFPVPTLPGDSQPQIEIKIGNFSRSWPLTPSQVKAHTAQLDVYDDASDLKYKTFSGTLSWDATHVRFTLKSLATNNGSIAASQIIDADEDDIDGKLQLKVTFMGKAVEVPIHFKSLRTLKSTDDGKLETKSLRVAVVTTP